MGQTRGELNQEYGGSLAWSTASPRHPTSPVAPSGISTRRVYGTDAGAFITPTSLVLGSRAFSHFFLTVRVGATSGNTAI
jgi:hypothetical protein